MNADCEVVGIGTGSYQEGFVYHDGYDWPLPLCRDMRRVVVEELKGFDAVSQTLGLGRSPLTQHFRNGQFAT